MTANARAIGPRPGSNADRVIKYILAFGPTKISKLCAELDVVRSTLANSLTLPRDQGMIACEGFEDDHLVTVPGATASAPAPSAAPAWPQPAARFPEPAAPGQAKVAAWPAQDQPTEPEKKAEPAPAPTATPMTVHVVVDNQVTKSDLPLAEEQRPIEVTPTPAAVHDAPAPVVAQQQSRFDYAFWGKSGRLFLEKGGARIELELEETRDLCNYLDRQFGQMDA